MTEIKILSVCGSGTVSSAMVGERIVELLEEYGYEVEIQEVNQEWSKEQLLIMILI